MKGYTSMPNIAQAIKVEIVRLSHHEIHAAVNPLKKSKFHSKENCLGIEKARVTSKEIRILRTKLDLSQEKLYGIKEKD